MRDSHKPVDVIRNTLEIRESNAAQRFRQTMRQLREGVEAGKINDVCKELDQYAEVLARSFGSPEDHGDVLWSLAASVGKAAVLPTPAGPRIDSGAKFGAAGGKRLFAWWRGRKFALISKTLRAARKADSLQAEVKRLFNWQLSGDDLAVLRELEHVGADSATPPRSA